MHGVTHRDRRFRRSAQRLAVVAVAVVPVLAACSDSESPSPEVPTTDAPQQDVSHGPFFPECGGISDEQMTELTQVAGLVNTAKTSVGCQWLAGGSILGPHFSFTWFRGSPIGRERKTMELSRTSVEDITIKSLPDYRNDLAQEALTRTNGPWVGYHTTIGSEIPSPPTPG